MNYLAISLGPIYATITKARKTRELWIASYLFSSLMREIYKQLENKVQILSPLPPRAGVDHTLFGAGIFPDRLFAVADDLQPDELEELIKNAVNTVASKALPGSIGKKHLKVTNGILTYRKADHKEAAEAFWQNYFRIVRLWKELDPAKDNILLELNKYLDTAELQPVYFAEEPETDYCLAMLDHPYKSDFKSALINDRGIYKKVMPSNSLFPSTAEIAAHELFIVDAAKTKVLLHNADRKHQLEEEQIETLSEDDLEFEEKGLDAFYKAVWQDPVLKNRAADYHKYYCIVHVDGDNFGKVLGAMSGPNQHSKVDSFSKNLAEFTVTAANTIDKYGGKPVYIGGDDLLFFAPLRTEIENDRGIGEIVSLWDLVGSLDKDFEDFINKLQLAEDVLTPTLSYGISISYYKYPLFEAHNISHDQLVDRAKKFKKGAHEKNAVAFRWLRHSGAYFEGVLTKDQFLGMKAILGMIDEIPGEFFSSIAFKLDTLSALVNGMVETKAFTEERLQALFENFFDEPVHRNHRDGLHSIEGLMRELFTGANACVDGKSLDPAQNLYAVLRLLMFMTSTLEKSKPLNPVEHAQS